MIMQIKLDIFSWNVNGLQNNRKAAQVREKMFRAKGIYLVQETQRLSQHQLHAFGLANVVLTTDYSQPCPTWCWWVRIRFPVWSKFSE